MRPASRLDLRTIRIYRGSGPWRHVAGFRYLVNGQEYCLYNGVNWADRPKKLPPEDLSEAIDDLEGALYWFLDSVWRALW